MYTKKDLLSDIERMNIDPKGTLLIHSSMKTVGEVEGGGDTVIDAFLEYMKDGLLIFPTHTWRQMRGDCRLFDSRVDPACIGILPNLFLKREGVVRSLHPTHSVAAIGKGAEEYVAGEEKTTSPCPRNGCWGKLIDKNAEILFLGCKLRSNTFIHGVEEWNNIPDRLDSQLQAFTVIDANGKEFTVNQHRHACSVSEDVSENYIKLEPAFKKHEAIRYGKFGNAQCVIGSAVKMERIASSLLEKEPNLFLSNEPIPESLY